MRIHHRLAPWGAGAGAARLAPVLGFLILVCFGFVGCQPGGATAQLPTPVFGTLEIPNPAANGAWMTYSTSNPPVEVLPVRGRAIRIYFYAPVGSVFSVSLVEQATAGSASVVTSLAQNNGTPAASDTGFFQILSENPNSTQAIYHMYVRAPANLLANPANYDISVINRSLRTNATDSSAMVVSLRARKVYTVSVAVTGNGHVTSNPSGIECGTSYSGRPLTTCTADFGPGQVMLNPNSNNDPSGQPTTRFLGWTGNCPQSPQSCSLVLDGAGAVTANAIFGPTGNGGSLPTRPAAPVVSGWRWIGEPGCSLTSQAGTPTLQWDPQGYVCCTTAGPGQQGSPRCAGQTAFPADCRNQPNQGLNALLIQPGGCYEPATDT